MGKAWARSGWGNDGKLLGRCITHHERTEQTSFQIGRFLSAQSNTQAGGEKQVAHPARGGWPKNFVPQFKTQPRRFVAFGVNANLLCA
jgi:hypothetical protein